MSSYEQFCFLLTFPFYILCLTKCKYPSKSFCEEYLFSQLFFKCFSYSPMINVQDLMESYIHQCMFPIQ